MTISRRSLLSWIWALGLTACAPRTRESSIPQVREPIQQETNRILSQDVWTLFQTMYASNHQDDIQLLSEVLNNGFQDISLIEALKSFQTQNGLVADGTLGPATLKQLYLQHFQLLPTLSPMQIKRLEIYEALQNYEADRWRVPTSIPDVFDNKKFFGGGNIQDFINLPQTYIAQGLSGTALKDTPKTLFIERDNQGKMILRLYDITWNLFLACYTSGGASQNRSPEEQSGTTWAEDWHTHLYHVSSSYPEEWDAGAPMYAATRVNDDGIWIHSSADTIDGYDHSHGCFRVGLYYAQALHDYVSKYWEVDIQIGNLYS